MTRTLRTLLLSVSALGALVTAAAAAPPTAPPFNDPTARTHATMMDGSAMQAHMAGHGVDANQVRRWHDPAGSMANMHQNGGDHPSHHHDTPGR